MEDEKIDIIFLTETDTKALEKEESYCVKGYHTIFPKRKVFNSKIRIIALIRETLMPRIKLRNDLMSDEFPSIWIEINNVPHKSLLISGFYRQWTHETLPKDEAEQNGITILTNQMELATSEKKDVMILGDANLCSLKWSDTKSLHKNIANQLINCLKQNGLSSKEVGTTFVADHVQNNGDISVSNIDHVYSSSNVSQRITQIKLVKNTSSDHHLVLVNYNPLTNKSSKTRKSYKRKITKRSMKNFNKL